MEKNALKKFAVWARRELISRVSQKALQYGISEKDCGEANVDSVNGRVLTPNEKSQRNSLIEKIKSVGYQEAMEEAAYTWFNRFTALRYMEVNGYLPSHVRVFTDEANNFKPQIIDEAIHLDIEGIDMDKVYAYKEANDTEELYKYLLITQCNAFKEILPGMFSSITDFTILLFPDNVLREGSVLEQMISIIPEEDWKDQVQIIGWLYQYYNTEQNELVYDGNLSKELIPKELLPAATTIYTPDWSVKYMVENSLGRLWVNGHPDSNTKAEWKYYLEETMQANEVSNVIEPEKIKFIDPCMGSGHILVYAFDVLMQIYLSCGYTERDAAQSIIRNNLWGLDLSKRAYQLAYFAVMMKARQYDRRFLSRGVTPNLSHFQDLPVVNYSLLDEPIKSFVEQFEYADIYGSLTPIQADDKLDEALNDFQGNLDLSLSHMDHLALLYKILSQRYEVVCTNPPYLGSGRFNAELSNFTKKFFEDEKNDLSMVMFRHCVDNLVTSHGYVSFITTSSWFFLSSFEKLRNYILNSYQVDSIVDYGTELFDGKVGHNPIVSWVLRKTKPYKDIFAVRLVEYCYARRDEKESEFFNEKNRYIAKQDNFSKISGSPIAYWVSDAFFRTFENASINEYASTNNGFTTGDNNKFLRLWFEVEQNKIEYHNQSHDTLKGLSAKWFPYNKGGDCRKWYGNNEYVINWGNEGQEIKAYGHLVPRSMKFQFKESVTWNKITSGTNSFRYKPYGHMFDVGGLSMFTKDHETLLYLMALCNTTYVKSVLKIISPTLNCETGHVSSIPVIYDKNKAPDILRLVNENISLSEQDWDSFETSWDFKMHPFMKHITHSPEERTVASSVGSVVYCPIEYAYTMWQFECEDRREKLKTNEEELNRIFIDIYNLQDELIPEVDDKDITVSEANLQKDIKSFISYAIGCMFGRYSLDTEGLAYAGGEWDESKYRSFIPDNDGIIPICDNEYFDDDLTGLFVQFVKTVFGEDTLEENLKYIADALSGKGNPRTVIRNYFLKDFYSDHCKTYQKRPIYWLFDSGKKNGFKALIYMHRYQPDTIARLRTDYVHEQQSRYRTAIADIEKRISGASGSEAVKLNKELDKLNYQADELITYEEMIHHLADQMIKIDLDDGVKHNYEIFKDVLAKVK